MKIFKIFARDLKVSLRQFITLWIMIIPVLMALVINAVSPGITDSPITVALIRGENPAQAEYFAKYLKVEMFDTVEQIETRVLARDDITAVVPDGPGYTVLVQGNEPENLVSGVKLVLTYQQENVIEDDSLINIHSFGRTDSPLKIALTTSLVLFVTILSGMLIATNIVEEKADRTIRAIRVAPVRAGSFVLGKSLIGAANSLVCTLLCVLAAGFTGVKFSQILLISICASFISFVAGFLTGLGSDDFISALSSLKIIMIPALAPILAIELLSEKWQWLFYWSPFYWAYDGIKGVLSQTIRWDRVLTDTALVAAISLVVFFILSSSIKRKLV